MKSWKNRAQKLLIIQNWTFFLVLAWLPKRPILGRNRNLNGSSCLLSIYSLIRAKTDLRIIWDRTRKMYYWKYNNSFRSLISCAITLTLIFDWNHSFISICLLLCRFNKCGFWNHGTIICLLTYKIWFYF